MKIIIIIIIITIKDCSF